MVACLRCVLHPSWIQMFDARELSILISGSSTGFNVADLREHTVYAGGYTVARLHYIETITNSSNIFQH